MFTILYDLQILNLQICRIKYPKKLIISRSLLSTRHLHNNTLCPTILKWLGHKGNFANKKTLTKKLGAQVQVCAIMVSQLIFHERDNVKCSPTFNRPKNLNNNNFNKFNVLQKLVVTNDNCTKTL